MPSMQDVARAAGVSMKTVSRVLNESDAVKAATRERVLAAIQALAYRPNAAARTLVTRRSSMLGVSVPDISNPYFAELVRAVQDGAERAGYSLLVSNSDEDPDKEAANVRQLQGRQVDGVLLCSSRIDDDRISEIVGSGTPVVLVNRTHPDPRVGSVEIDEATGIRELVRVLLDRGIRTIGMIAGPHESRSAAIKLRAYREALRVAGIEPQSAWVEPIRWRTPSNGEFQPAIHAGLDAMQALLDRGVPELRAVLAYDDLVAIGAIEACRARGLQVPGDLEIAGFDDIWIARYGTPQLTTVNVDLYGVGRQAVEVLLGLLGARPKPRITQRIGPRIVFRESLSERSRGDA
jgi:LacI family transcriptional regulator